MADKQYSDYLERQREDFRRLLSGRNIASVSNVMNIIQDACQSWVDNNGTPQAIQDRIERILSQNMDALIYATMGVETDWGKPKVKENSLVYNLLKELIDTQVRDAVKRSVEHYKIEWDKRHIEDLACMVESSYEHHYRYQLRRQLETAMATMVKNDADMIVKSFMYSTDIPIPSQFKPKPPQRIDDLPKASQYLVEGLLNVVTVEGLVSVNGDSEINEFNPNTDKIGLFHVALYAYNNATVKIVTDGDQYWPVYNGKIESEFEYGPDRIFGLMGKLDKQKIKEATKTYIDNHTTDDSENEA